ncbi:MAG TPA: hypothetical protein VHG28_20875 [Longimicrobiaceae bacterium]|nr:hypothetical protein [Longimicrobiaceae bacterium]
MTTKERAIQVIERLPADATLDQIVDTLQHMEPETTAEPSEESLPALPDGGVWDLLEQAAGTVEMPADWASEHDHYLYGTPKRTSAV